MGTGEAICHRSSPAFQPLVLRVILPSLTPLNRKPTQHKMKNIYTTLLAGASLVLTTGANAQHTGKAGLHHPVATQSIRPTNYHSGLRGGGTPPNDECDGAVNQDLAVGSTVTFTGDNTGATDSPGADSLGIGQTWETFTLSECANLTIDYCGTAGPFGNAFTALFIDCPFSDWIVAGSFDQTTCPDGNVSLFYEGVPAGQYYYAVMADPDNAAVGPYTLNVTASSCASAPANDECDGAIPLSSGADCVATPFLTTGATSSMDAIECDGYTSPESNDVWFSFVATSVDQTIGVQGFNESDPFVELFEGTCAGLTSLACQDTTFPQSVGENTSEQLIYSGLTVGTTYFVRVYDYAHASPDHSFEICVTEGLGNNIGIEEADLSEWVLFPNPGTGVFNLRYAGKNGLGNIEVFDVTGRIVYNAQQQLANGTTHSMDLTGLGVGNYNVRLTVNGTRTEQRLMVK